MDNKRFYNYLEKLYYFTKNKRIKASEKLLPYIEFKYELCKIELMEERYNIDTNINKDNILFSILNQCITDEMHEINIAFMEFYSDIKLYVDMLDDIMKILSKMINTTEICDKNK